jgi:hypothetical protein
MYGKPWLSQIRHGFVELEDYVDNVFPGSERVKIAVQRHQVKGVVGALSEKVIPDALVCVMAMYDFVIPLKPLRGTSVPYGFVVQEEDMHR